MSIDMSDYRRRLLEGRWDPSPLLTFNVGGPPRTKKNSSELKYSKAQGRVVTAPSDAFMEYQARIKGAFLQLPVKQRRETPFTGSLWVKALCACDSHMGDLVGYLQAIGDALQHAKVIVNDKLIDSWDGSRRWRCELTPGLAPHTRIEIYELIYQLPGGTNAND